jgi:hypothetical protein
MPTGLKKLKKIKLNFLTAAKLGIVKVTILKIKGTKIKAVIV